MIAEVIVDIAYSEVDKIFDYSCNNLNVRAGCRVVVPFGRTKVEGFVIAIKESSDFASDKIKPIIRVIDETEAITAEHLQLLKFMQEKYHLPAALILRLFLPTEMRKGKVREKMVDFVYLNKEISSADALSAIGARAKNQVLAYEYMQKNEKVKISELKKLFGNSSINSLVEKNILLVDKERVNRSPYSHLNTQNRRFDLTAYQKNAIDSVISTDKCVTLLHGVTGSGKTAVYLELIKENVESGKSAIFLVPEIALTPQMLAQLRAWFGDSCAILHSGLSAGERFDEWWRLRSGEAKIAIGARSAVFAPLENLGLIIIDEEHDGSYESESSPRYSTFDVAFFRAKYNNCKLLLGSATPSIEAYLRVESGEFNLVNMPERINKKPLPEMIIADMRNEIRRGNNSVFSSALKDELEKCLANGNQAIIFINRRGYSQQVICRECGYVAKCDNCDITLNYHSVGNLLKCHYCGSQYKMLTSCPQCGGVHINYVGTGTQKIVEDVKKLFPYARVLRMDNDTTQNKEGHFKILKEFGSGNADILVGTQMIAKGHDFPKVTLVAVLDADMSLFFSDYRSGERTFQLITQVAGRSGRSDNKGVVVLQTYAPENWVLRYAINYDYLGFYKRESAIRKATCFPPFSTILRVMVEAEKEEESIEGLRLVYETIKEIYENNKDAFVFFNKMRSPKKRLKNKYRCQILMRIKAGNDELINQIYSQSLKFTNSKLLVYVEKNPSNMF